MRKKKKKIKGKILFLILTTSVILSFFYSREIYTFYYKTYYEKFKGETTDKMLQKAYNMLDKGEHQKLQNYLRTLKIIYPDNKEFRKIDGLNMIAMGQKGQGVDTILSSVKDNRVPKEILEDTVKTLFEQNAYEDVTLILKKNDPGDNLNILFYYGVSLYKIGNFSDAILRLKEAEREGRTDFELYLYLGMSYDKNGNLREAIKYLERAREIRQGDMNVNMQLAQVYRKLGRLDDAEKLLRNQRK